MPPATSTYAPSAATTAAYSAVNSYKAPDAQTTLTQAQGQYGVPQEQQRVSDLQKNVGNLQSSINAVDPSVTGRTTGTFTTEAQRQALVNAERQPLQTDYGTASTSLSNEQGNLNMANSNASTLASAMMSGNQQKYQQLLDAYNASQAQDQAATQAKQFEQSLAAQKAATKQVATGPTFGNIPNGSQQPSQPAKNANDVTAPTLTGNKSKQDAYNAVQTLLHTNNPNLIRETINAIQASANYGNSYDQYKVQLLNSSTNPAVKQLLANMGGATF